MNTTVPCELCARPTHKLGTKRCDRCWELEHRIAGDPKLAATILARVGYEPLHLSKGERYLATRALAHFIHDQQQLITIAWQEYVAPHIGKEETKAAIKARAVFEDHKKHHEDAIRAADDLRDRLCRRTGGAS